MGEHALDYQDKLLDDVDAYYLCRRVECTIFCKAKQWVTTDQQAVAQIVPDEIADEEKGYQFRCPGCVEQFQRDRPPAQQSFRRTK